MVSERRKWLKTDFHPLIERHAVWQVGERIVVRQVLDLFLGDKSFGDVLEGDNEAAGRHGPI